MLCALNALEILNFDHDSNPQQATRNGGSSGKHIHCIARNLTSLNHHRSEAEKQDVTNKTLLPIDSHSWGADGAMFLEPFYAKRNVGVHPHKRSHDHWWLIHPIDFFETGHGEWLFARPEAGALLETR
jgi:hypothetical protein